MQIGFISFGEAAFELSSGLKQQGLENILAFDPMWDHPTFGALVQQRAQTAKVELFRSPEEVVQRVNVLIVAVPADKALEVSERIKPYLKSDCVYIDVSASNPEVKRKISEHIQDKGTSFVDAAMMGPLPVYKHQVPILASGNGTDTFIQLMSPFGMQISKVSENPGDASAVKLIRSIFMKGMPALLIEMLEAAHEFNVDQMVINSISETMNGKTFEQTMNRLVTGTSIHALRRAIELEGSIEMLESSSLNSAMSRATNEKLKLVSEYNLKEKFAGKTPDSWLEVIKAIHDKTEKQDVDIV